MSNYYYRNLMILVLLVSTVTLSCHFIEVENDSAHDVELNKTHS